jgi:cellulose-binding protein/uncharacterized protein DUF5060
MDNLERELQIIMKTHTYIFIFFLLTCCLAHSVEFEHGALAGDRYRIIISSDIGGSDPDDFQSMIYLMMYADLFDIEGIISSPWDKGRAQHILDVINVYEKDYPKLNVHFDFPKPDILRSITKQSETERAPLKGYRISTEGSDWIIQCAKRNDARPLYILVWGLLEDVAQALHDAPEIHNKIRVVYIGGPNKKWGADAYHYIEQNFPDLWMIENNSTYRGFWVGGKQDGSYGNKTFFEEHILHHGKLGNFFGDFYSGSIKMGDTPTLLYMMYGDPDKPDGESWGGSFQRTRQRPYFRFNGHTKLEDKIEMFSVAEWVFDGPEIDVDMDKPQFDVQISKQLFQGYYTGGGKYVFRWTPKAVGKWSYIIHSPHEFMDGKSGKFTSVTEGALTTSINKVTHTNWWTDDFDPILKESGHSGIKTVNRWRKDYLQHWQKRLDWVK